jgi:predicted Zn finger-like uncharacterized protein
MNVPCTHCRTVYRIDPHKVPERGVRARCALCRGVFAVNRSGAATQVDGAPAAAQVPRGAPAAAQVSRGAPAAQVPRGAPSPPPPPAATPHPELRSVAPEPSGSVDLQGSAPAPGAAAQPRFGQQDPHSKARRLARALVSDMVTYHPERQRRGLSEGSLRQEFREEIRKSWEEYVEQVGKELAHSTPYFRDALNEILARGQQIF